MVIRTGPVTIPTAVIKRLPMYYRYLADLDRKGISRISSRELSQIMDITSSQLRQDLSYFGEFGQQGFGYRVEDLYGAICTIIGIENIYPTVLIGAGNLGKAIAKYPGFRRRGIELVGIFDLPDKAGEEIEGIPVYPVNILQSFLLENIVRLGIITTPAESAQQLANELVKGGVSGIWNFAPIPVFVPDDVVAENIHIGDSLLSLLFKIKHKENNELAPN